MNSILDKVDPPPSPPLIYSYHLHDLTPTSLTLYFLQEIFEAVKFFIVLQAKVLKL